jgi:hypothetical protein
MSMRLQRREDTELGVLPEVWGFGMDRIKSNLFWESCKRSNHEGKAGFG